MGYKLFCFPLYIMYLINVHLLQEQISFFLCYQCYDEHSPCQSMKYNGIQICY